MIRESELLATALRLRENHAQERNELARRTAMVAADLPDVWELVEPLIDAGELVRVQAHGATGLAVYSIKPGLSAGRVCVTIHGAVVDRETGLLLFPAPACIASSALQALSDALWSIEMPDTSPVNLVASMIAVETIAGLGVAPMVKA